MIDSDNENSYPFAGYENIISSIFDKVNKRTNSKILDIGVGTGNLSSRLYKEGHRNRSRFFK